MPLDAEQPTTQVLSDAPAKRTNALIGSLGLRAGWSIALFLILAVAFISGIGFLAVRATGEQAAMQAQRKQAQAIAREAKARHTAPALQAMSLPLVSVGEFTQVSGVLLAAAALAYIERRRFGVYGLALRRLRDLLPGALWGLVAMGLLVGLLRALHLLVFDGRLLRGSAVFRYGLGWLLFFLMVGIAEEFIFRGYVQFTLMRGLLGLGRRLAPAHPRGTAFWLSAVFWSLLFCTAHLSNAGENSIGLLSVFGAGILFSYALWRTGSLWWGIGFHMTWDWSQSFLYGTPDSGTLSAGRLFQTHAVGSPLLSGGIDGPEGSLFGTAVFLVAFLAIRLQPKAAQPPVESKIQVVIAGTYSKTIV